LKVILKVRKFSRLVTVLVSSIAITLSALSASSVATASENETVTSSFSFPTGSSVLTKSQKAKIKKAVTTAGKDGTFLVTGAAGRLPGVSDNEVQLLAKKRGQVVKAYLVKLGVSKANVTTEAKSTRLGMVPKTKIVGSFTAPPPSASPSPSASPTTPVALTCATGGTCLVGDTGPGGGIVYYVDYAGFNCGESFTNTGSPTGGLCKYLEVAPSGWNNGGTPAADPTKVWAVTANQSSDVYDVTNDSSAYNNALAIGLGHKNSVAIETLNGATYNAVSNDYAAGAALAYASNSKSDWYLPTTAELNLLCQWNRGVPQDVTTQCLNGTLNGGTGASSAGLGALKYWSSSEWVAPITWYQDFLYGGQFNYYKDYAFYVRPVRAF
jgi:hypothetical protein